MCQVDVPQRNLGQETQESLAAQQAAVPEQYRLDAIYQPLRQLLGLQGVERNLNGFAGGYLPTDAAGHFTGGIQGLPGYPTGTAPSGSTTPGYVTSPRVGNNPVSGTFAPDTNVTGDGDLTTYPSGGQTPPPGATTTPIGTIVTQGDSQGGPAYRWNGTGWEAGSNLAGAGTGGYTFRLNEGSPVLNTLPNGFVYNGPGGTVGGGTGSVPGTGTPGTTGTYVPAQRGLLDLFENDVTPSLTRMQTSASTDLRNATMSDVNRLAPGLRSNYDAANPESAALRAQLNDLASSGMQSGLTDYETRAAQQASRAAQSARGFGYGSNDAFDEAMNLALDNQQRREANRQFGLQVQGANNASAIDPWAAITGQSSLGAGAAAAGGFFRPPAGTTFDPFNAYSSDLFSSNQNAAAAEAQANNIVGNFASNL